MSASPSIHERAWTQPTAYERWYESSLGRSYAESLEAVLRPWLAGAGNRRILDAGCGPGLDIERFFPTPSDVLGMDCSWEMARRALQRCAGSRPIVVASIEQMPLHDESCDLVFCVNCLEFVEDRQAAFGEVARVLRPGGRAVFGVLNRRSVWELTRRLWRPFRRASYYQGRFFRTDELEAYCRTAGLHLQESLSVAHFPPVPPGPLGSVYGRIDRFSRRHQLPGGAVILARAVKRTDADDP